MASDDVATAILRPKSAPYRLLVEDNVANDDNTVVSINQVILQCHLILHCKT
eukprot:Pgem_evm1s9806